MSMNRSRIILLAVTVAAWLAVAVLALFLNGVGAGPAMEPIKLG